MRLRRAHMVCVLIALLSSAGCAILQEENRRLLNMLDDAVADTVTTDTATGRVLFAPFYVPVGLVAGAADAVLVNPSVAAPAAGREAYDIVWKGQPGGRVEQVLMFAPKVVATPVVFAGYWLFFSLFPVEF